MEKDLHTEIIISAVSDRTGAPLMSPAQSSAVTVNVYLDFRS